MISAQSGQKVLIFHSNGDGIGVNNGLNGKPASGKIPINTLGSTIVNFGVDPVAGKLTQQDYFQPLNYAKLNSGDKDISSSGVSLLDSTTFSGGGVNRVGISGSKAGIVYVVDADNLGGYRMGVNATDAGKPSYLLLPKLADLEIAQSSRKSHSRAPSTPV